MRVSLRGERAGGGREERERERRPYLLWVDMLAIRWIRLLVNVEGLRGRGMGHLRLG